MHILFLSDNFPPEVNAPASRTYEHAREWVRQGANVTVLTCAPNFPTGRVLPGYRNLPWQEEWMEGIRVVRLWSYITANEGFAKRVLDYMSFMASAMVAAPWVRNVDVIVGTSPQFFTALAARASSALRRIPYVFELRDLWPESIRAVGAMQDSRVLDWLELLELSLYRNAVGIVSVTQSFRENLMARGIPGDRIRVITNGVDLSRYQPSRKDPALTESLGLQDRFVVGYIGTHGMAHGLETLLNAAAQMQERDANLEVKTPTHFLLLGDGARKDELRKQARDMQLRNVTFLNSVPKEEVPRYWGLLDAAIIHLKKTPLFETVIPSKLFECMGMGLPVLHGVAGESARIVEAEEVGLLFPPEDHVALCGQIQTLRESDELRAAFRDHALRGAQKYDRANLAHEMLDFLRECAQSH